MRYEVIITPTYTTKADVEMSIMLDISKFDVTVSSSNVLDNGSGSYTVTIPKNTVGMDGNSKYHTGIFLTPKDETTSKEDAIVYGETIIDKTISSDDSKYKYSSKIAVKDYTITYNLDGEEWAVKTYPFNAEIVPLEDPELEEGYSFSGWVNEPTRMPLGNLVINGTRNPKYYILAYEIDGALTYSAKTQYKSDITIKDNPDKTGYTFSGWSGFPEDNKMPAHDVTVTGNFTINQYTLTINLDGNPLTSVTQDYNTVINFSIDDEVEGYDIIGKENIPSRMPAEDKTIDLISKVHQHKLTYIVDEKEYSSITLDYDTIITPLAEPTKEGYTFSGWSEIPSKMPDNDVTVNGTYNIKYHTVTFKVINKEDDATVFIYSANTAYGTDLTAIEPSYTPETGKDLTESWTDMPEGNKMPDNDIVLTKTTSWIPRTLTYVIEETTAGTQEYHYGQTISALTAETRDGYTFSWSGITETMPNEDKTVYGIYTEISEKIYYGSIFNSDYETYNLSTLNNVNVNKTDGNSIIVTQASVDITEDDLGNLEYLSENKPIHIILVPSEITSYKIEEIAGGFTIDITSKFLSKKVSTVDGVEYNVLVRDRENEGEQFYPTFAGGDTEQYTYKITY